MGYQIWFCTLKYGLMSLQIFTIHPNQTTCKQIVLLCGNCIFCTFSVFGPGNFWYFDQWSPELSHRKAWFFFFPRTSVAHRTALSYPQKSNVYSAVDDSFPLGTTKFQKLHFPASASQSCSPQVSFFFFLLFKMEESWQLVLQSPGVLQPWVSACRIRLAKDTPIVSLKSKHKWDLFLRLHSEEPSDGDGLVIFGLEMQTSKDTVPQIGPHWISV